MNSNNQSRKELFKKKGKKLSSDDMFFFPPKVEKGKKVKLVFLNDIRNAFRLKTVCKSLKVSVPVVNGYKDERTGNIDVDAFNIIDEYDICSNKIKYVYVSVPITVLGIVNIKGYKTKTDKVRVVSTTYDKHSGMEMKKIRIPYEIFKDILREQDCLIAGENPNGEIKYRSRLFNIFDYCHEPLNIELTGEKRKNIAFVIVNAEL